MDERLHSSVVGVYYVSAPVEPGSQPNDLAVRIVTTLDVDSGESSTRVVKGADAACLALREWMAALCTASGDGRAQTLPG